MTVYSGSMPLLKKNEKLGEVVDLHAAREVVLDDGEGVAQGEGELADRRIKKNDALFNRRKGTAVLVSCQACDSSAEDGALRVLHRPEALCFGVLWRLGRARGQGGLSAQESEPDRIGCQLVGISTFIAVWYRVIMYRREAIL